VTTVKRPSRTEQIPVRIAALAPTAKERRETIAEVRDYLARTGLQTADFARHINYATSTMGLFLADKYHEVGGDDSNIRRAVRDFMAAHPIEAPTRVAGDLYDTENTRRIRETFQKLLPRPVAYVIYAPPGSQKTFALENELARFNREEIGKNGHGRRAYYVYARQNLKPRDLMRRICIACGVPASSEIDRMLANLRFQFRSRRVLLIVDEAQHLEIESLETLRELLDQPPHISLLFAGSHDLKEKFDRFSATLEQWNSRIIAKVRLPGLQREEAEGIIQREIGDLLAKLPAPRAQKVVESIIAQSTTRDAFEKGRTYINVRTLTNALWQTRAAANEKEAVA
jgi:DNA transposition AAA+ family ATPase